MSDKRRCFVIGPIGKPGSEERRHADMLLNAVVKSVLESDDFPYEVIRSDHVADPGMINDKVIHDILNAELVVADLTFLNANAFYELVSGTRERLREIDAAMRSELDDDSSMARSLMEERRILLERIKPLL